MPPLLGALLLARAWRKAEPVQRQAWLAPLLAGLYLRRRGRTKAHLLSFTLGLRLLRPKPRAGRTHVEQLLQDLAILEVAARESLAQHDRLMLAKALLARKGRGRRQTSALPRLAALLLNSPLVNVPMIAETLKISPQAAPNSGPRPGADIARDHRTPALPCLDHRMSKPARLTRRSDVSRCKGLFQPVSPFCCRAQRIFQSQ